MTERAWVNFPANAGKFSRDKKSPRLPRIRAERKAGELLRAMEKARRGPDRPSQTSQRTTPDSKTLDQLGISRDQSSKWQKLAAVPAAEFEAWSNATALFGDGRKHNRMM